MLSVAYSPLGDEVATAGNDMLARLWDPETARKTNSTRGSQTGIGYSSDGQRAITWHDGGDGGANIWDLRTNAWPSASAATTTSSSAPR